MKKPLAFSYVRMSTTAQLAGDSLRRQIELSRKFAEEQDLQLVERLEDIGVSAFKGKNAKEGALGEFLASVAKGEIPPGSYLLIESFDRLSRQEILNSLKLFIEILDGGITIATLIDRQIYRPGQTDFQQLLVTITLLSRANEESATKSRRLAEAWQNKRAKASERKLTKKCPAWMMLSDDGTRFILIDEKVSVVRRIFDLATEGHGSYAIARLLNRESVEPIGLNRLWIKSYISKILTSRTVLGEFQPHRKQDGKRIPEGNPIENYFPYIITEDQFYRVQSLRFSRKMGGRGRLGKDTPNLFKNIAKCRYCGMPMHFVNKGNGPKGGKYLRCSGAMNASGCDGTVWRYADFETSFLFFCAEVNLAEIFDASHKLEASSILKERIRELNELLSAKGQERERVFTLVSNSSVGIDYIGKKLEALSAEIQEISTNISELSDGISTADKVDLTSKDDLDQFLRLLYDAPDAEKAAIRARVHNRLLRIVESLKLSPAGSGPRTTSMLSLLSTEFDSQRIEKFLAEAPEIMDRNKQFEVSFVGGTNRLVVVESDDPKKFKSMVQIVDGNITFEHHKPSPVVDWANASNVSIADILKLNEDDE